MTDKTENVPEWRIREAGGFFRVQVKRSKRGIWRTIDIIRTRAAADAMLAARKDSQ